MNYESTMIPFFMIAFLRARPVGGNLKFINRADSSAHVELEGKLCVPLTSYPVCP